QLGTKVPEVKMQTAKDIYYKVYESIQNGDIISASDVSEGGSIITLIEMAIAGKKGFNIQVTDKVKTLFAEVPAAFVLEMKDLDAADRLIESELAVQIGTTTGIQKAVVNDHKGTIIDLEISELEELWKTPFTKYFD
ncbi:MAG: hypothetical protein KAS62_11075, partial [Candidatus Delongbacteria bacterium]|nr:hypothetical protein [Candidatus Delongbacteria bacterium]